MDGRRGGSWASSPLGLPSSGGRFFGLGGVDIGDGLAFVGGVQSVVIVRNGK